MNGRTVRTSAIKTLLLFDIDGTILNTGGAGKRAMIQAFEEVYGVKDGFRGIRMSGKTDPLILKEALLQAGLPEDGERTEKFKLRYFERLAAEIEKPNPGKILLPGIEELILYLSERSDIIPGLLTGNWRKGAALKLGHFGLFHCFRLGAFGDDSADREKLLPFALKRFKRLFDFTLPLEHVFVIGDTPRDIRSARPYGAKAVGIATGTYSADILKEEHPDFIFENLQNWGDFLKILTPGRSEIE
ncbi:phosphoglycolate phosphatase [bacterium BMS3Abin05]|nr:phosphoglycolate phosphatase [bacterium BMS3Abin05]GBE27288.1 phosphoglycolate phosphatase [bacterium BMS3Bbin03]HDZ12195.1 HAD family hydrolase [Bacteroidota bacterium]